MTSEHTHEAARQQLGKFIESLKPTKARLLQYLLDRFGTFVPRRELIDSALGGIPFEDPENAVGVHLSGLRKQIASYGFEIEGRVNHGSRLKWKACVDA